MPAKRTIVKRTVRKSTVPRGVRSKTVAIRRRYARGALISDPTSTVVNGSIAFNLSDCPSYTDFTNMFDCYRIVKAKVDFLPGCTGNHAYNAVYSLFHMCTDATDVTAPTDFTQVLQYDNSKTVQPYKPFSLTLKPSPAASYWQGLSATGYGPRAGAWIDCKSPSVQHYGVKYVWQCNSSPATRIDPWITLWMEFKDAQ